MSATVMEQQRAGRREWIGLGALMLPLLLVSMDVLVLFFGAVHQRRPGADQHPAAVDLRRVRLRAGRPADHDLLVLAPVLIPEFRNSNPGRFDLVSSVLSIGS